MLSVIDDDAQLEKAISVAEQILGDLDIPHRGLLFAVPITQVVGLRKTKPAPAESAPVTPSVSPVEDSAIGPQEITRHTPVAAAEEHLKLEATVVETGMDLVSVARAIVQNPAVHVACVINSRKKLVGLIPSGNVGR